MKFNGQKVEIRVYDVDGIVHEFKINSISSMREKGMYSFGLSAKQSKVLKGLKIDSVHLHLDGIDNSAFAKFEGLGDSVDGRFMFFHFSFRR